MQRKNFDRYSSLKAKHKVMSRRVHKNKPGRITLKYDEKTALTKGIDFMQRGKIKLPKKKKPIVNKSIEWRMNMQPAPLEEFTSKRNWWHNLPDIVSIVDNA